MPTLAAMAYKTSIGQPIIYPRNDLNYAENFLHMMFAGAPPGRRPVACSARSLLGPARPRGQPLAAGHEACLAGARHHVPALRQVTNKTGSDLPSARTPALPRSALGAL